MIILSKKNGSIVAVIAIITSFILFLIVGSTMSLSDEIIFYIKTILCLIVFFSGLYACITMQKPGYGTAVALITLFFAMWLLKAM